MVLFWTNWDHPKMANLLNGLMIFYLDWIFLGLFTRVKSILNRFTAVTEWGMSAGATMEHLYFGFSEIPDSCKGK